MKKLFSVLIFLAAFFTVMLFGSVTASAESYSGSCGSSVSWSLDTETGVLDITGSGAMTNYSSYSSAPWYSYSSSVKTVNIGKSVTSIGDYAFYYCTELTSITIPNSVTSIGSYAFYGCSGPTKVNITDLSAWCRISFGSYEANPLYYAGHFYLNGTEVTDLVIPDNVTSIGSYAFYNCTGLTSVTIGSGVTSIGSSAFSGCSGLTKVNITDLSAWCRISFGSYEANPLYYAKHLYLNGTEITDLVIPDDVTSIGNYAFYNCTGLTSITIPNSVTSIGSSAFSGRTGLTEINYNAKSVDDLTHSSDVFRGAGTAGDGIKVTFGDSVEKIPAYLFYVNSSSYRPKITSVTIGTGVTSIGSYAFYGCTGLTRVNITDLSAWCKISFGSYNANPLVFAKHFYLNGTEVTDLVIPDDVTSIGNFAFYNCTGLTSIEIPNSVTSIGSSAFSGCTGLNTITIPNGVTSIGSYAFEDCPATIYGEFGSEAERYALENGMKFIELPEKIKIFYMPDKLTYSLNSKLDLEGLIVAVYYPSGLLEWRYKGFEVSGFDTSAPGTKTVTIKYLGATASFNIEVTGVIGDGNGDGKIDAEDLTVLTNALISGAEYNGSLDMNGDGKFDILDFINLKKYLADNTDLPVEQSNPQPLLTVVPETASLPEVSEF